MPSVPGHGHSGGLTHKEALKPTVLSCVGRKAPPCARGIVSGTGLGLGSSGNRRVAIGRRAGREAEQSRGGGCGQVEAHAEPEAFTVDFPKHRGANTI